MQQSNLWETVLHKFAEGNSFIISFTLDAVANSIGEFTYYPEEGINIASYFWRYEEIFRSECKIWIDEIKVRLLLRKLSPAKHEKYCNFFA